MKFWNRNFQRIALALIVVFVLQVLVPTLSFAFPGFFMYSSSDGKLRGYVYVKDPTKVSVDITNNGSVTTITYDNDKVKESFISNPYFSYDNANNKLKNVNFNQVGYTSNTAPSKIVASDGQTMQEFTKETDLNGDVRYFGENTRLGYYRISGEQFLSPLGANKILPRNSTLVSFIPAINDSSDIQLTLPFSDNGPVIDFSRLAVSDFTLIDITAGLNVDLTYLNRVKGYQDIFQHPNHYLSRVITIETSEMLLKDHRYELRLSPSSNSDEIKLPVQGIYSFDVVLGSVEGQYNDQGSVDYYFEGHSASYFDNVQIKNASQLKINPDSMYIGLEKDFNVFRQYDDGFTEEVTDYEIVGLTYSDAGHPAISFDRSTKKIIALNSGSATFLLKINGITYSFTINVIGSNVGGGGVGTGGGGFLQYLFEDQDPIRGQIHPKVSWMTSSESNYSGYQVIISDASGKALGQPLSIPKHDLSGSKYEVDIASNQLPTGAAYVDVIPKDVGGHVGTEVWRTQIFDKTANSPVDTTSNFAISAPIFLDVQFKDQDTTLGGLGGPIRWYDASISPATSYSIYFVDANNAKLKPIAEIPRNNFIRNDQGVTLPSYEILLPNGYPVPTGAKRFGIFGKNDQGESTEGYYFGFWDKIAGTLGNDYFEDSDNRANHINGVLSWTPMLNEANIEGYAVQFLGSNFEPIGISFAKIDKGKQQYSISMQDNQIPAEAKSIALGAFNAASEYLGVGLYSISDNVGGEAASSSRVDQQLPGIFQIMSYDLDGEAGELGGDFRFYPDPNARNSSISRYDVYFVNEQLQKLKPIISLQKNTVGFYQTSIPMNTKVPNGATKLAIYGVTATGESVPSTIDINDRIYSPSLLPSQINITNNKSDSLDTITISGLQANDVISVYRDATSLNSFLVGSVEQSASSISFTVPQLGKEEGKLYFTLQRNNGTRSLKVEKAYAAETVTPVIPPAPIGGGGGGGGPVDTVKWDIVNQNGTIRITSSVDPDQIRKLAADQSKAGKREIPIDLKTKAEGYDFQINTSLINEIKGKMDDAVLVVNTTLGTARIPFGVLEEAMKANGGTDKMSLKVSIDALPSASQQDLEKTISSKGGESVGKALSYELSLMDTNKTVATIDSFSEFVGHVIILPKDYKLNPGEKLIGAVWDPKTNELVSVPLTFTPEKDGNPAYVTLWKKGNSIYTVYKSEKHFADVQDDYFAKADVESLASSHVIEGFEDGSFRADVSVTRAEFATLLGRGLGLKSVNSSDKRFSDVNAKDWFSQAVYTAVSSGLINGYEDETFRPNQSITHQEAITMISNALRYINSVSKLDDSDRAFYVKRMNELALKVDDWAIDSTALALKRNVLNASNGFSFKKDSNTTRGEAALLINKLLQNASWPEN